MEQKWWELVCRRVERKMVVAAVEVEQQKRMVVVEVVVEQQKRMVGVVVVVRRTRMAGVGVVRRWR